MKRIALALKLDEKRVAELLQGTAAEPSQQRKTTAAGASTTTSSSSGVKSSGNISSAFGSGSDAVYAASAAAGVRLAPPSLSEDIGLAGRLLGCFGDIFTASLDVGWKSEPDEDGSQPPKCMLTVANNDITRVRQSLMSARSDLSRRVQSCSQTRL